MKTTKQLLSLGLMLGFTSLSANAALVTQGLGVYDSTANLAWTQDANLLGTLEAANSTLVSIIISDIGSVTDSLGTHTLVAGDFGSDGAVDWWGAEAYVAYLNHINYDGSNQWALPTSNAVLGYYSGSQLGNLFYTALGGTAGNSIPSGPFSNVQSYAY